MRRSLTNMALTALLGVSTVGCGPEPTTTTTTGGSGTGGGGGGGSGGDSSGGGGAGDPGGGSNPDGELGCGKMDIVFVIDNSGSMGDEKQSLAQSFPRMIEVLDAFKGGSLDYRVAVTTTAFPIAEGIPFLDTGEKGAFLKTASMQRSWLERGDPNLTATFSEIANVPTAALAIQEQPLRAALASVTERMDDGTNAGFLRPDALLAVILVTDEDDQSVRPGQFDLFGETAPVTDFVSGFDQATGARSRWATTVIAGDRACEGDLGSAEEATRLLQFVDEAGENATFSSICQPDLSKPLEDALNTFKLACDVFVF